jgi:DNA-binding NarL/FixJ family response regulator
VYTTADGLARDEINRIVRDSHGFLWFATAEGLSRFDGYRFTNYTTDQGLPHRSVNDLLEARDGTYWVATDDGLCRFDPAWSPMFTVYYPGAEKAARSVTALAEDRTGAVWVGTRAGVYRVEEALERVGSDPPDVVLTDIGLPGMDGIEGVRRLKERHPGLVILMLTVYDDDGRVFDALCAGACGYLLKKTPPARLLEAVREAHEGGAPMTPEIARKVVALFQKTARPEQLDEDLTPHEIRLLKLLAEGYSYQDAADTFGVSINTLRNHIRSIYDKLHVHSKSEAVSKALRYRLIS